MQERTEFPQGELGDYAEGLRFPAGKGEILAHARKKRLPPEIIGQLEKIPDKEYDDLGELISSAVKGTL